MKVIITHDVFDISKRIKNLDVNYYIVYDTRLCRYEIHNSKYSNTLCLVLPFDCLDCRAIEYVRKSENVEECLNEIEINNQRINQHKQNAIKDRTTYQLNEIYKYASRKGEFDGKAYLSTWY